jgi:hypothetical protein
MPETDPIQTAFGLPNGARFYKCALQVNPHHYEASYRGQPSDLDEETYVRELISKAAENEITILAVTDHNHIASVPLIQAEAAKFNIQVLPGFEISSSEGVHVLCIYPADTSTDQLNRYLGEFGFRTPALEQTIPQKIFPMFSSVSVSREEFPSRPMSPMTTVY